jgi:hypothetical protein
MVEASAVALWARSLLWSSRRGFILGNHDEQRALGQEPET